MDYTDEEIKQGLEYLLTDKDVQRIISKRSSKVVSYPELGDYNSIEDLFGNTDKIILLYVNSKNGNSLSGHWVLLTRVFRNKKTIVEFNDPYSSFPDDILKHYSHNWRKESGQDDKLLTRLLYNFSLQPNCEVQYNEVPFQKESPNINTCGRHSALRGFFYRLPLEKYQEAMKQIKKNGIDLDKAVVLLTDKLNGGKLR